MLFLCTILFFVSLVMFFVFVFFFFKQKTAYEMRISDWSSDVCSSDLLARFLPRHAREDFGRGLCFAPPERHAAPRKSVRYRGRDAADRRLLPPAPHRRDARLFGAVDAPAPDRGLDRQLFELSAILARGGRSAAGLSARSEIGRAHV